MASAITTERLRQYRNARERLIEARQREFPVGRGVRVAHERFHGYGLIVDDDGCPLDQLAVKLENGNTWWYELDTCSLASRDACPSWLQRLIKFESRSVIKRLQAQKAIE